jgi:trk system potassium uptake protein TrkH
LNIIFLLLGGMHWLEALCTAFGTAGTGGLGTRSDSMASYSPYIQYVTATFMTLYAINFSCYYLILLRQFKSVFRDEELRVYLCIVAASIGLIMVDLGSRYASTEETFRHAFFQVSSIITTTGYSTADFDLWPSFSKMILVTLMITGGCAGSTCGGMKLARVLLLFKSLRRNIRQVMRPSSVQVVRSNGRVVDESVLANTNAYLAAYVIIAVLSVLVISLDGFSPATNITAMLACFNNIGPGLEAVGPACNYSGFSILSKLVLIFDMLAGRLEIFPLLVLLSRNTWRRH